MNSSFLLGRVLLIRAWHGVTDELSRSALKTATVLFGAAALLTGVFAASRYGLEALMGFPGLGEVLASRLPGLIYLVLVGMLTMSSAVTFHGVFFRGSETAFLHAMPVSRRIVLVARWFEALLLSTWAFPAMALPFHVALWAVLHANLGYLLSFSVFLPAFSILAATAGALIACAVVALGPLWRYLRIGGVLAGGSALVLWAIRNREATQVQLQSDPVLFLQATLARFNLGFSPHFPSGWWYLGAESLRAGDLTQAAGYWACIASTGLLLLWVLAGLAPTVLYRVWTQWSGSSKEPSVRALGPTVERFLGFLRPELRALIAKDIRLLVRDPSQWAQTLFLFGLMGVYVASLRGMSYHSLPVPWRLLVVTANFGAVAGILASLGTRFFFPLPSLEARMAWVVRVSPVRPSHTVWAKVALAVAWTLPPALAIAVGTIVMLGLPASLVALAILDTFLLDLTLMSMSVGLGILLPEAGQEEPARIVSGLGGTTALLLGLGYVLFAAAVVWVQVGWVPWVAPAVSRRLGTLLLGGVSLGITWSVLRAAARKAYALEVSG